MAHATARGAYGALADRLNRFPQGAPPSDLLYRILSLLFTEREAGLVARLPIRPVTARRAARIWGMREAEARTVLDGLASRCILLDMEGPNGTLYILPPPMAGFFEFSMMRVRDDIDQHLLAELFWQYITVEDDFIVSLFTHGETQLGRVFVNEPALTDARPAAGTKATRMQILDYERASEVIGTAQHMGVGVCYCRHKAEHVGKACKAPMNICMTFGGSADSLIRHGYARRVDKAEGMDLLAQAYESRLVQFGENVQRDAGFICNCCGCCCEAMIAQRRFGSLNPVHTTNSLPHVDEATCNGCGKCVDTCPVEAMTLVSANDPAKPHARGHAPPHGADGDRAGPAPGLHLRQPGAAQPPGDGRRPGCDPEAAAHQAGARDAADALPLPGEAPRARQGLGRGRRATSGLGATRARG